MSDGEKVSGFVSLKALKQGAPDAAAALADLRRIYFRTTRKTIENDFAHAIDLLKSLPTEEDREKAAVFMEGLAQMRREWATVDRKARPAKTGVGTQAAGSNGRTGKRLPPRPRGASKKQTKKQP